MIPAFLHVTVRDMDGTALGNAPMDAELRGGAFWQVKNDNVVVVDRSGVAASLDIHWIDAGIRWRCELPPETVMETGLMHLDWKDHPIGRIS